MNSVAKVSIVANLILSVMFMMGSMMVYATHRNWKDLADKRQQELTNLRSSNSQLTETIEQEKTRLAHERAARRLALARLETQVQEKQQQLETRQREYTELLGKQRAETDAVVNAQRQLDEQNKQIEALQEEIRVARQDRDQQFDRVRDLTDQMHQAEGIKVRLEDRLQQLTEDHTRATTVLKAKGLTLDTPVDNIPPSVRGNVLALNDDMVEISIGEDDGVRPGHEVVLSRNEKYLGLAVINRVTPDRAVGRIKYRKAPIQEGDRVQTKTEIR